MLKLVFRYSDGSSVPVEVSRYTTLRADVPKVMLHLDRLPDGKHLLIVNEGLLPVNAARNQTANLVRIDVERTGKET